MSYARWSAESDVYVFLGDGLLECCTCPLLEDDLASATFTTTDEMLAHLRDHVAAGHDVPQYTFDGLERDRAQNERYIATGRL